MIKINQIANDSKSILVDIDGSVAVRPASYLAEELPNNIVRIIPIQCVSDIALAGVSVKSIQINGTSFESAAEAVKAFNQFGNFKSGAETSSPTPTITTDDTLTGLGTADNPLRVNKKGIRKEHLNNEIIQVQDVPHSVWITMTTTEQENGTMWVITAD